MEAALLQLLASSPWLLVVWLAVRTLTAAVRALPAWLVEMTEARRVMDAYIDERQRRRLPDSSA